MMHSSYVSLDQVLLAEAGKERAIGQSSLCLVTTSHLASLEFLIKISTLQELTPVGGGYQFSREAHLRDSYSLKLKAFPVASAREGDVGVIIGSGRSNGRSREDPLENETATVLNPLQYSCLENPMDREAWQATVHGSQRGGHTLGTKQQWCETRILGMVSD